MIQCPVCTRRCPRHVLQCVARQLRAAYPCAAARGRDTDVRGSNTQRAHVGNRTPAGPQRSYWLVALRGRGLVLERRRSRTALRRHLRSMRRQQVLTFDPHIGHIIATLLRGFRMPVVRSALCGRPRRLIT